MADTITTRNLSQSYVYQIKVDGVDRYIGKGTRDRVNEHVRMARKIARWRGEGRKVRTTRFYNRLIKAINAGQNIKARIIVDGLTDDQAFEEERDIISAYPPGYLWNVFEGGNGFSSEYIKAKWRDTAYRLASSARSKANWENPEFRRNQHERRSSEEYRQHASAALKAALSSPETRRKMSDAKTKASPEFKKEIADRLRAAQPDGTIAASKKLKELWADPQWRANILAARRTARQQGRGRWLKGEGYKRLPD